MSDSVHPQTSPLHSIVERIRATRGCIDCSVFQESGNRCLVVFEEKWKSDTDLQSHLRSDDYRKILLVVEMADAHPEIRFETVATFGGVEIIEGARSKLEQ